MNFFKRATKRKAREDDNEEELLSQPKAKKSMVSWIKDKFNKLLKNNDSSTFLQQYGQTPANLKVHRYVLSPENLSLTQTSLETFYIKDTYVPVTENKLYEFKAAGGRYFQDILPVHVRKYGCGFLNSSGGVLMAGIRDDGLVIGVYLTPRKKDMIYSTVFKEFQKFRPNVKGFYKVEFHNVHSMARNCNDVHMPIKDLYIMELHVLKGLEGEIYEDRLHNVYIRREASMEGPLAPIKIKELVLANYKKMLEAASRKRKSTCNEETCDLESVKRRKTTSKTAIPPIAFNL